MTGSELLTEYRDKVCREQTAAARAQFDAGVKAAGIARTEWRTEEGEIVLSGATRSVLKSMTVPVLMPH